MGQYGYLPTVLGKRNKKNYKTIQRIMKLITALGAVVAYGTTYSLLHSGFPVLPLYVSLFASAGAIALIMVEWATN